MNITEVDGGLADVFGRYSENWQPTDPLLKLIQRVVGQRTTHAHVQRAMANLQAACPTWADVAAAPHDLLVDLIRPAGLARSKAAAVQGILAQVYVDTGAYSLDFLLDWDNAQAARYLCSLPGVGDHTAALVLMFALGRRGVMPVDTHVHRVARRLGWAEPEATARAVQQAVERAAPEMDMMDLHVNLVRLGERHCTPGMPGCPECPVSEFCRTARLQPWW